MKGAPVAVQPFKVNVPNSQLTDLRDRLARTRWPDEIEGSGWGYGFPLAYLKELVDYWRNKYDWRKQERSLNAFPQFKATVDGLGIHFIHVKGKGPKPAPLLLLHGWPGAFYEFHKVVGPLADPAAYGGDAKDAFDVVVASLPGYGFSDHPKAPGFNNKRIGDLLHKLMTESLGYKRFALQGGDWGAITGARMAYDYPEAFIGLHLNLVPSSQHTGAPAPPPTPEEQRYLDESAKWRDEESGYAQIQRTKPQTLSYGLNDSPAGLCAWFVEKYRTLSDCGGDIERVYTKDELLTTAMIYWVSQSISSSTRLYYEVKHHPAFLEPGRRIDVPSAFAIYPGEISRPPRSWAERFFGGIHRWTVMPRGGHFPALEAPQLYVEDVRAAFRSLRT